MQVSGIEVVVQFCVDPEKSKAWYADFLRLETTPYPSPLFVLGGSTLLLAPGAPGTGRGGTGVGVGAFKASSSTRTNRSMSRWKSGSDRTRLPLR